MALTTKPLPELEGSARTESFALLELPHELLLDITDFLDISDVICLSLCNHTLNAKLSHFRNSPHLREERVRRELLLRLAKHDLAVFFCYYCARLHSTSRVPPPALLGVKLPSDALQCLTQPVGQALLHRPCHIHGRSSAYQLGFQHLQVAIPTTSSALVQTSLDMLATTQIQITTLSRSPLLLATTLLSIEPRMVNEHLHLRVQHWITFHSGGFESLNFAVTGWNVAVCAHINQDRVLQHADIPDILHCKLHHGHRVPRHCQTCKSLLRCTVCGTEFQIEAVSLRNCDCKAFVVTKWLNLGRGQDPSDPQWQLHLRDAPLRFPIRSIIAGADQQHGTRAKYERLPGKSLADITRSNSTMLDPEWYRNLLRKHPASTSVRQIYVEPSALSGQSNRNRNWWNLMKLTCPVTFVAMALKVGLANSIAILVCLAVLSVLGICIL